MSVVCMFCWQLPPTSARFLFFFGLPLMENPPLFLHVTRSFSLRIILTCFFFILLIPMTISPCRALKYNNVLILSLAKITSLSLLVDPEPAVKVFGCYCQRELGEWKGFFFMSGAKRGFECLTDTSWMDVIYSRESCCANDECNKTTEVPLKIRKRLTATCYITAVLC